MTSKTKNDLIFDTIYRAAQTAGNFAGLRNTPVPMIVQQHASPMDDNSPVVQSWYEPEGMCGFAWVVIRPGTCAFAKWLVKKGYAKPAYGGGVSIWIGGYNQSVERKESHAIAMAEYLRKVGIKAYAQSRLD